jgi:glycerol-3-phosphate cytidylyltransferase-like family protein
MNTVRDEYLDGNNAKYLNIFAPSHCSVLEAASALGDGILDKPVFAVVRNPYDRLVSMFFFAKKYDLGKIYDIDTEDFDKFAEQFYKHSADPNFFHAKTQKEFVAGAAVTVGRFENLAEDVEAFIRDNNIDTLTVDNFPKLNSTVHDEYREYYSDHSKSIVQDMWSEDLEYFSYSY